MLRFYLEYASSAKREPTGNVIATDGTGDGYVAVYPHPNSSVAYGAVPLSYLTAFCKKITREEAKRVHPKLFVRLSDDGWNISSEEGAVD